MLFTPAFFLLIFHGWAYAFSNWLYSLPLCLLFTGCYHAVVASLDIGTATDVWYYRFTPAIIAWLANIVLTEAILKFNGIRISGIKGKESYPFDVIREAVIFSAICLFVIYDAIIPNLMMLWILFAMVILIFFTLAKSHWRFDTDIEVAHYYSIWFYLFTTTCICNAIGAIFLPENDQSDAGYTLLAFVIAGIHWLFTLGTFISMKSSRQHSSFTSPTIV